MIEVRETAVFARWLARLRDLQARARIEARIDRLSLGNFGDTRADGRGVREIRIDWGPGYRVYFVLRGPQVVILLAGGDKRSQRQDIALAIELAREIQGDSTWPR